MRQMMIALFLLLLTPWAQATGYGSLNNFDAVNDNGVPCHGFEIEIEGIHSVDISYTYDWNHYGVPTITDDNSDPLHPRVFVRYASKKNPDGSWASYTAVPAGPIAPTDGHQFTNPNVNFGGEHFGVGFYGAPVSVKYHWLIDDGAGNLINGTAVNIGTPTFTYYPPVNAVPAQVQAVIEPPPPIEVPVKEFGEPSWLKVITTQTHNNNKVELWDLVSDDPDDPNDENWRNGEPDEVEVEWQLMQTEFNKVNGGANGEQIGAPEELPDGDEIITRRYEFFKYVGPIDPETGEAKADSVGLDDLHGSGTTTIDGVEIDLSEVVVVGDYIGAQMAGFDPVGQLGLILNLQDGEINVPYVERRVVIGGIAPVVTEVVGTVPEGMILDVISGILSGTPQVSGLFPFTVNSRDDAGTTATMSYNLFIADAPGPEMRTVFTSVTPAGGGTTFGSGDYAVGTEATVTAAPNVGYAFESWTENGTEVSQAAEYKFILTEDRTLVANFSLIPVPVYRNVGDLVTIVESGKTTTLNRLTRKLTSTASVRISNHSQTSIGAPMKLIITGLPAGVTMPDASGKTAEGNYYFDLQSKLGLASLPPAASATLTLRFVYPMTLRIAYGLQFWGMAP